MPVPNSPPPLPCSRPSSADQGPPVSHGLRPLAPAPIADPAAAAWDEIAESPTLPFENQEHFLVFSAEDELSADPELACETAFDCEEGVDESASLDWQAADD